MMLKQFACGDVVQGGKFVVTAENETELMTRVAKHAAMAHGIDEVTPELIEKVRLATRHLGG